MGQRYLIDSNVIIDYTANLFPQDASNFLENILNTDFLISVAVKIEVLGYDDVPSKLSAMEEFVGTASIIHLGDEEISQAILLRRKYKKLKLGDAIIAASAIVHDLTVVTRNVDDFKNIAELRIINPWDK